jgi:putative tricarboxylic transport membrane protein
LTISQGDWTTFLTRPISAVFLAIALALAVGPTLWRAMALARRASA